MITKVKSKKKQELEGERLYFYLAFNTKSGAKLHYVLARGEGGIRHFYKKEGGKTKQCLHSHFYEGTAVIY